MVNKMADFRNGASCPRDRDLICIDTHRVLDSCRDKDCFEDVRVYLTCMGQEIIDRTSVVRAKCAKVLWSCINIDSVPFNRGFYQLFIRIYVKLTFEACIGPGNLQEFEGVAAVEKKVILFGGEGNVSVFRSEYGGGFCDCGTSRTHGTNTLPVAVLETVDPIVLDTRVAEPHKPCRCSCCCTVDEIPDCVCRAVNCDLTDDADGALLLVSLGFFSVVRIERPAQYLISAVEYTVPEKECVMPETADPCSMFRQMAFPVAEFSSSGCVTASVIPDGEKKCGCGEKREARQSE